MGPPLVGLRMEGILMTCVRCGVWYADPSGCPDEGCQQFWLLVTLA